MNVLFTSSGRRVELISFFKREGFTTFAADSDPTAPSLYTVNKGFIVPRVVDNSEKYVEVLLNICKKEHIKVIVPLIDPELPILAKEKAMFSKAGMVVLLSYYSSVKLAADKYAAHNFYEEVGLFSPETLTLDNKEMVKEEITQDIFPALLKPKYGSAGEGIVKCPDINWFNFFSSIQNIHDYVLQKYVSGEEITIDIFGDGTGKVISAVQRKRLKIRGGEVERGITVKYPELFEDAVKFSKKFKPFGPINIQCFYNKQEGRRFYTEINARFGGGYPLAYYAGANFPKYIKVLLSGNTLESMIGKDYKEGLIMSRFDEAIYKYREELLYTNESFI